ncbi:MAG: hypothetical protein ACRC33_18775 [Gemmataceae bacterium]
MAKQDFIPDADPAFLVWLQNYKTQLAAVAAAVGVTPAEVTAADADFTAVQTKINTLAAKKAEQQAATADKRATRLAVERRARALAQRIKNHPNFTAAVGEQLGVVGPEESTDLAAEKPTLVARSVATGAVTIGFNKSVSSGVRILSKRGAEAGFTFLAIDTESPYVDNRPNLGAGPETRQYQAQYLDGDDPVGLLSDVLVVTVPG